MGMEKTVCELFAGVGGFRCGLNSIKDKDFSLLSETWKTVWFNQWEPGKKNQWAYDCYVKHFGTSLDLNGDDTTNVDISIVDKNAIPNHNLLVGGFPCQDYSVARSLNGEKGIEGKKGVLWWSIWDILKIKRPPFVLLENVDRLLLSPSKQRGRDFGIILSCFYNEDYFVEWRVVNAAEYGEVQRRRRTFIFAYKKNTNFAKSLNLENNNSLISEVLEKKSFFAKCFPIEKLDVFSIRKTTISGDLADISDNFSFDFANSGIMFEGSVYTAKTYPVITKSRTIGEILESKRVAEKYFISNDKLYFTNSDSTHSDETKTELSSEAKKTWQYIKGAKRKYRTASNGHKYIYSEGAIPMVDEWDKPARTMLTSEGSFNRSTHIVRDLLNNKIRILTPKETERIQGFPDDWTATGMPEKFRYFCMGNALVVSLVSRMEKILDKIFSEE